MTLRGVLLDLDGTLGDHTEAELAAWKVNLATLRERFPEIDPAELRARYEESAPRHYVRLANGEVDLRGYWRARLADAIGPWGVPDDALFDRYAAVKERMWEGIQPLPGLDALLSGLRAAGLRLGLLTNGPSELQRRKIGLLALEERLDALAISGEIGAAKPDAIAYERALTLLGTSAHETAMVGDDRVNDIDGALAAGLARAVWLTAGEVRDLPAGAVVARSLGDVPGALGL
jgi:putative hydrolase of the HAD superfamily